MLLLTATMSVCRALSNRFGSWLMLVYGHFTRFVHRSQLSQRGFKRLSRAIQALRRS